MKICSEKLGDEVAESVSGCLSEVGGRGLHVLQGRDEDVAQTDDLRCCQDWLTPRRGVGVVRTFSCLRCLSSFNSR